MNTNVTSLLKKLLVLSLAVATAAPLCAQMGSGGGGGGGAEVPTLARLAAKCVVRDQRINPYGMPRECSRMIDEEHAEIDAQLSQAARMNDLVTVRRLLEFGANPNFRDVFGWTPLHDAATRGNAAMVNALIRHFADLNAADRHGWTPLLHCVAATGNDNDDDTIATMYELIRHGADPNAADRRGRTPLHCAASTGDTAIAAILVEAGANVNAADEDGKTPLRFAVRHNRTTIVQILRAAGAREGFTGMLSSFCQSLLPVVITAIVRFHND